MRKCEFNEQLLALTRQMNALRLATKQKQDSMQEELAAAYARIQELESK